MELRLLGPLDVVVDGRRVPLGAEKQRRLLTVLALHANEPVAADRLIDALWPDDPPESALNTLQGYVSRLRSALDAGRKNGDGSVIVFRQRAYALRADPTEIDAVRFERLVGEAEAAMARADAAGAATLLRQALGLWRGAALAEFADEPFAQAAIARLEEGRLRALELRIDADLMTGRHRVLVAELEELVRKHPLSERFRGQLMLALYRCGRQTEALDAYRDIRALLKDRLGIEPTPWLRGLERALLQHDPALATPPSVASPLARRRPRRAVVAGAATLVLVAAVVAIAVVRRAGGTGPVIIRVNSVAVVDSRSNAVVDDVQVGDYPGPIVAGGGSVWVGNIGDDTVTRIGTATRRPSFATGVQQPLALALTARALWIANGTSFATSPPSGGGTIQRRGLQWGEVETIPVGPPLTPNEWSTTIAADGQSVWVANAPSRTVTRLDSATGRVLRRIRNVGGGGLAVGFGSVWVAEPARGTVARISLAGRAPVIRLPVSSRPTRIAVGDDAVWVMTVSPHSAVWRIEPRSGQTVAVIPVPPTARNLAAGAGAVWVTSGTYVGEPGVPSRPGVLSRVDPKSNSVVATITIGFRPDGVAVADGLVWVAVAPRR